MGSKPSKEKLEITGGRQQQRPKTIRIGNEDVDLASLPARVDRVNVAGLDRTKDDYVTRVADDLFKAKNLQEVYDESRKTMHYLETLGIFKDIQVDIAQSKGKKATKDGFEITYKGVELSRIIGSIGTDIGQNEGSLTTELTSPNLWGRGERLSLQGSYSSSKTSDLSIKLIKPFYHTSFKHYKPDISVGLFKNTTSIPISACKTINFGMTTEMNFQTFALLPLSHILQYEFSFRELYPAFREVPFFVREHCGPRMASLIRAITIYDGRDQGIFPRNGFHIKTMNELCGIGGDMPYLKTTAHAEMNFPFIANSTIQVCSKIGSILTPPTSEKEVPLSSRFTLGGPINLRGFRLGGAGPHVGGYACGLNSYWAVGTHLWAPIPFSNRLGEHSQNIRSHLFCNFGNCNTFDLNGLRLAVGLGLAYSFAGRARLELNYCFPIKKESTDVIHKGFQFGIGFEFI